MIAILEIWNALHLIGLCLAFGGVCLADFTGFAILVRSGSKKRLFPTVEMLHTSIFLGLLILILSGIAILNARFETLAEIPVKVWCKSILVVGLIINGVYIQKRIIPLIRTMVESDVKNPFIQYFNCKTRLRFSICSSISSLGWIGGFSMGTLAIFKQLLFFEIIAILGLLWISLFFITLITLDFTAKYFQLQNSDQKKCQKRRTAIDTAPLFR